MALICINGLRECDGCGSCRTRRPCDVYNAETEENNRSFCTCDEELMLYRSCAEKFTDTQHIKYTEKDI